MSFLVNTKKYAKKVSVQIWQVFKYYSFFYVGTNYLIPVGVVVCRGSSMEPTLRNNDILLTEKVSVRRQRIQKDDIVVAKHPIKSNRIVCKRVYEYAGGELNDGIQTVDMPYGYVYLKGDNTEVSNDSQHYGAIPYGLVQSRAFLRIWPLNEIKFFGRSTKTS